MQPPLQSREIAGKAEEILARVGLLDNAYFKELESGAMTLDAFRKSQEQFFFAVTFFPRPMAALVGRIPHPRLRLDVLQNLVEEHGEFQEAKFHHTTFLKFLRTFGARADELENAGPIVAVRAFNSVLTSACVLDELEVGICCMGIIEFAFARISALIARCVVERGWIPADQLMHYDLHAEIDERHAEEFFAVVQDRWNEPSRRYYIEQGLELGAYAFNRLYQDLHAYGLT
jgi:pyrroloquinoline-quinone synthase